MIYQHVHVQNDSRIPPGILRRVESAIQEESLAESFAWGTSVVLFEKDGWRVTLNAPVEHEYNGATTLPIGGYHSHDTTGPYAVVHTGRANYRRWAPAFSHEVIEMIADPYTDGNEICDAIEGRAFSINGIPLADFQLPDGLDEAGIMNQPLAIDTVNTPTFGLP